MRHKNQIAGFRVLSHIGKGAASEIYAVQDPKSKQVWALKHVIKNSDKDQRFLDQAESEYNVGAKLDHRNIRKLQKLIKHRKLIKVTDLVLLMELVDGIALDQRIPRTYSEIVEVVTQVAHALAHMHHSGFVHADLKPSNILVTEEGTVKLIDLGQSCPIGTVKKRIQGTPGYMAPEQAHRREITEQTDIYNFGATVYWVLMREVIPTALPPKSEENASLYGGALDEEMIEPPVPPHIKNPRIPQVLSKLVLDCVQIDPAHRPESMDLICRRLELIAEVIGQPTMPAATGTMDDTAH